MNSLYTFIKKYPAIIQQITIFTRLPAIHQINDHRADLSACICCLPAYLSPRYAHKNGPPINPNNPNGPRTMPKIGRIITAITRPIVLPRTPRLLPPNFLVPRAGMLYSNTAIQATIIAQTIKNIQLKGCAEVSCKRMNAIYTRIGPGNTGTIEPIIARTHKIIHTILRTISICR